VAAASSLTLRGVVLFEVSAVIVGSGVFDSSSLKVAAGFSSTTFSGSSSAAAAEAAAIGVSKGEGSCCSCCGLSLCSSRLLLFGKTTATSRDGATSV
jgi:hypothetical protein